MSATIKTRPIPFTTAMVQALLAGRKSVTRRVVRSSQCLSNDIDGPAAGLCPYGKPGDQLWVRETHRPIWGQTPGYLICVDYRADPPERWTRLGDEIGMPAKWIGGRFMRREYSRILLRVTEVRVERVQEISETDAIAEGCLVGSVDHARHSGTDIVRCGPTARDAYRDLWGTINGPRSWDDNPSVWVVAFERVPI